MIRLLGALALLCLMAGEAGAEQCRASWYGGGEKLNRHSANGDVFDPRKLTAAHKSLPFGTRVRVTYRGKSVTVTITDRGPFVRGRCLDLTRAAADAIGLRPAGVGSVTFHVIR